MVADGAAGGGEKASKAIPRDMRVAYYSDRPSKFSAKAGRHCISLGEMPHSDRGLRNSCAGPGGTHADAQPHVPFVCK